jgi:hypothetical protein
MWPVPRDGDGKRKEFNYSGLTQQSRVLFEKLIVDNFVKAIPAFYGILSFITVFTSARNRTLFRAS